ncbi:dephospho-CoA kinase [Candidatus Photodesmus blepharus]|uniref:dephospho-CoA kinase n=1 Tax=Candidatus Photodesmus blepharonis TaxID=1179155 RepID=UPI000552C412|nr:dephospho-CoA kinase [Candidatus Photodesmus blepharus]
MVYIIGLTGGISSGKTTVANLFSRCFSIEVIDADIISREVVEPGTSCLKAITEHFGTEILLPGGELNRGLLREKIFFENEKKNWLNQLLHPLITKRMLSCLSNVHSPYVLLVIPLLVENNLHKMVDRVVVVDVEETIQVRRTMRRDNISECQVRSILNSQSSREERLLVADDVIENSSVEEGEILLQVKELHQKYLAICGVNL